MSARHRADVLARVAQYLEAEGVAGCTFEVEIRCKTVRIVIPCDEWPETPAQTEAAKGLWLSPLERRIVDFLAGRGGEWTRGEDVAAGLGEPHQHRFKALMTNLVDREVLESGSGAGFRVRGVPAARSA